MLPLLYVLLATARSSLKAQSELAVENLTAPQSPWQNPYCERVIGTIRRDCLDHVIALPLVGGLHHRYTRRAAHDPTQVETAFDFDRLGGVVAALAAL